MHSSSQTSRHMADEAAFGSWPIEIVYHGSRAQCKGLIGGALSHLLSAIYRNLVSVIVKS
ncbi:hypothetical protein FHV99_002754 [Ochrobactrum sp. P20RRXII]|nr:hypothetical protein [Ochrobactrum sp. P20RRXII]